MPKDKDTFGPWIYVLMGAIVFLICVLLFGCELGPDFFKNLVGAGADATKEVAPRIPGALSGGPVGWVLIGVGWINAAVLGFMKRQRDTQKAITANGGTPA